MADGSLTGPWLARDGFSKALIFQFRIGEGQGVVFQEWKQHHRHGTQARALAGGELSPALELLVYHSQRG
jgi:hypothetical protein